MHLTLLLCGMKSKVRTIQNLSWMFYDADQCNNSNGGGVDCASTFFRQLFLHEKEVWRSQISWLFPIHYELSENQKTIGVFTVFWGDLEDAGTINPHPQLSFIQKPPTIWVNQPSTYKVITQINCTGRVKKVNLDTDISNCFPRNFISSSYI